MVPWRALPIPVQFGIVSARSRYSALAKMAKFVAGRLKGVGMRIRVPRRYAALGFLLALLCLALATPPPANARPIDWGASGSGPPPDYPKGDNDGGVLAAQWARSNTLGTVESEGSITVVGTRHHWTAVRTVYSYAGLRGFLALMRLGVWPLQLR